MKDLEKVGFEQQDLLNIKKGLKQNQRSWISKTTKSSWTFHITWKDRKLYGKSGRIQIKKMTDYMWKFIMQETQAFQCQIVKSSSNLEEMERHLKV